jgi:ABC-type glycerol-3-phosphate transport system permease component
MKRWDLTLLAGVIGGLMNLPVILMMVNSLKATDEIVRRESFFPQVITLENYVRLWEGTNFPGWLMNSLIVSLGSTLFSVVCATMAGYAMSRFRNRLLDIWGVALFAIQMFPIILALIPLFILFRQLGLINHPLSVIIVYGVISLPFVTWMTRGYFDTIPRELEEAALIDGCGHFSAFVRIVLPLCAPGLAAVAIFAFLLSYNEFFIANVFLRDEDALTLPVGIQFFQQQFSTDWGGLTAAATVMMLPTLILFLMVQKYITGGALAGGVKG